jgi:hypothetical protein
MFSVKVLAGAALALGITAASANAQVVVSSKIDTEGGVLGNIIQLVLNANNIKTTDRIQLGGTPVVRKAITAGEIDIYPEYTGNAAFFFEKADDPVWKDAAKAYETARSSTTTPTRSSGCRHRRPTTPGRSRCARRLQGPISWRRSPISANTSRVGARWFWPPRPSSSIQRQPCRPSRPRMASRSSPTS